MSGQRHIFNNGTAWQSHIVFMFISLQHSTSLPWKEFNMCQGNIYSTRKSHNAVRQSIHCRCRTRFGLQFEILSSDGTSTDRNMIPITISRADGMTQHDRRYFTRSHCILGVEAQMINQTPTFMMKNIYSRTHLFGSKWHNDQYSFDMITSGVNSSLVAVASNQLLTNIRKRILYVFF